MKNFRKFISSNMRNNFIALTLALVTGLFVLAAAPSAQAQIAPFTTENGNITLSTDAIGTNNASGIVSVQKPAGATVRVAYLFAATTPGGGVISNTDITINGSPVTFNGTFANVFGFGTVNSYRGDVTSLVKPTIDAAPAGLVDFTVAENATRTGSIDGEILAVIFNDPNQTTSNTVVLFFGGQRSTGDTFSVLLGNPINTSATGFLLDLSLGISFSTSSAQFSRVDVGTNTRPAARLTTSAGGADDGMVSNGALITAGGIGDTNANPPVPTATPANDRSDDELYSLIPFVNNGDTTISVNTLNPSNDDNIFFAALVIGANAAVVGEGIVLGPPSATNPLGAPHTVTATVQNASGQPINNRAVTFSVISGPNTGTTGSSNTNASGQASFTYTSSIVGTDTIRASFINAAGQTMISNTVTKTWVAGTTPTPTPTPTATPTPTPTPTPNNVCTPTTTVTEGNLFPGGVVSFGVTSGPGSVTVDHVNAGTGLQSLTVVGTPVNAIVNIPAFTPGTTAPVTVTFTPINPGLGVDFTLRAASTFHAANIRVRCADTCTPTTTVTEGNLFPGGIVSFGITSGPGTVTVDHVNAGTGLQSLTVVGTPVNAVVMIPAFTPGTTDPVTVTYFVPDPSQPVDFTLRAASTFHAANIRARCGTAPPPAVKGGK